MNVLKVDYQSPGAEELFARSLRETGFGVLYHHPINQQLIDEVYSEWKCFFASPDKTRYRFRRETQDGYFPQSVSETAIGFSTKDLKEFFQIYPWGIFPAELSRRSYELYTELSQLAVTLLQWIENQLPPAIANQLSMPLSRMIEQSDQTMLRIIHYPPMQENNLEEEAVRASAHGDINLLTVLVGATTTGLQVQDAAGRWHEVPCDRNSIAVNIGDMLQMCTKGHYRSTIHRVINPAGAQSNVSRLSMPFFLHPNPEVRLSERYTAEDFLKERLLAIGVL